MFRLSNPRKRTTGVTRVLPRSSEHVYHCTHSWHTCEILRQLSKPLTYINVRVRTFTVWHNCRLLLLSVCGLFMCSLRGAVKTFTFLALAQSSQSFASLASLASPSFRPGFRELYSKLAYVNVYASRPLTPSTGECV